MGEEEDSQGLVCRVPWRSCIVVGDVTATVTEIRGKTEQRITSVISCLKAAKDRGSDWLTYDDLVVATGAAYDMLLYVLCTLLEVGLVEREDVPATTPGRPRVQFRWVGTVGRARALSAR